MSKKHIESKVLDHFTLVIDSEDGKPPRELKLCYTYKAIAKIEDKIGKDLKQFEDWKKLSSGKDFPAIVWGGLDKFHPDITLDEVLEFLNPAAQRLLEDEIFKLMFPGVMEQIEKAQAEGASPNPQAATPKQ